MKTGYYTIYFIFRKSDDKLLYIGKTSVTLSRRLQGHDIWDRATMYAKEVMYFATDKDASEWEEYLIRSYDLVNNGLNCSYGRCGYYGVHQPKEMVDKRVAAMKNYKHSEDTKNKIGDANSVRVMCIETGEIFNSLVAAARWCEGHDGKISAVCKGKRKTHNGYRWKYVD